MRRLARVGGVPLVLGICALVVVGIIALDRSGKSDGCSEGADFERARLLDRAALAYAHGDGRCDGAAKVSARQELATIDFERAEVHLNAARSIAPAKLSPAIRRKRARARKLAHERGARRALIRSLRRDPFRPGAIEDLNAVLERVPIRRTVKARQTSCRRVERLLNAGLPDQAQIVLARSVRGGFREHCRRCQGRSKTHPPAPVENAPTSWIGGARPAEPSRRRGGADGLVSP
jgi:hypothetical protein